MLPRPATSRRGAGDSSGSKTANKPLGKREWEI
jgi:hypothetical protein